MTDREQTRRRVSQLRILGWVLIAFLVLTMVHLAVTNW